MCCKQFSQTFCCTFDHARKISPLVLKVDVIISKYLPLVGVTQRVPLSSMMPRGEKSKLHKGKVKKKFNCQISFLKMM